MNTMIYNPEQAIEIANRLSSEAQTWLSIYTKLNSVISEMNQTFISQTQVAFNAANNANSAKYEQMKTLLEEMSTALKTAQNNMVIADEAEAQRIRARFMV